MTAPAYDETHATDVDRDGVDDRVEHEHARPVHPREGSVSRPGMDWAGMAIRIVLTLVGAAALILGAFMDWIRGTTAVKIDVRALWETGFDRGSETFLATIGFVSIVIGLLAILGLSPRTGWLTRIAGSLGIVLFVLFAIEVYRADLTVQDIDAGAWVVLAGGVVALIGGFFGARPAVVATTPTMVEGP